MGEVRVLVFAIAELLFLYIYICMFCAFSLFYFICPHIENHLWPVHRELRGDPISALYGAATDLPLPSDTCSVCVAYALVHRELRGDSFVVRLRE